MSDNAYFSLHAMDSLANEKYSARLPYYIKRKNGKYSIPVRTSEDYDRELSYAIDAGIDFFAYCCYLPGGIRSCE